MARPRKEIDREKLEALCRMAPTLKDAAAFFKVNQDTITDRCKEWGYEGFSDAREQNMVHTRLSLIRKAINMAEAGNATMLIFALKNLCGWADKIDSSTEIVKKPFVIQDENGKDVSVSYPDGDPNKDV